MLDYVWDRTVKSRDYVSLSLVCPQSINLYEERDRYSVSDWIYIRPLTHEQTKDKSSQKADKVESIKVSGKVNRKLKTV